MQLKQLLNKLEFLFSNLTSQIIIYICLAVLLAWQITALNFYKILAFSCDKLSHQLVENFDDNFKNSENINALSSRYGLSWIIETNKHLKIIRQYQPIKNKIGFQLIQNKSSFIFYNRSIFYDSVVSLNDKTNIHIGYVVNKFVDFENLFTPYVVRVNVYTFFVILAIGIFLVCATTLISLPILLSVKHYSASKHKNNFLQVLHDLTLSFCAFELRVLNDFLKSSKSQIDDLNKVSDFENSRLRKLLELEKIKLDKKYQTDFLELKSKIAELEYHKNINDFVKLLNDEITICQSLFKASSKIVNSLRDLFLENFLFSMLIYNKEGSFNTLALTGFDMQLVSELNSTIPFNLVYSSLQKSNNDFLIINKVDFSAYGLNKIDEYDNFERVIFFNVKFQNEPIGLYVILQTVRDKDLTASNINTLKELLKTISVSLVQLIRYQQQFEAARTDITTKVCNNKYFFEMIPLINQRMQKNSTENNCSLILLEVKHLHSVIKEFGQKASDKILQIVASLCKEQIPHIIPLDDEIMRAISGNHVIRYGNDRILIILENTNIMNSMQLANQINLSCQQGNIIWPNNILSIYLAIGVVTSPFNGQCIEDLIINAEKALFFANENLDQTSILHLFYVDDSKKEAINTNNLEGDLAILDPSALLQSIEISNKTGVLIAASKDDRKVSISFEHGKPIMANLDAIKGKDAIVEFITCFHNGKFTFQEQKKLKTGTILRLQNLDKDCLINKSLASLLMEAALAQDNLNWAQNVMSSASLTQIIEIENTHDLYNSILQNEENFNKVNKDALLTVIEQLNRKNTPLEILKYNEMPSHEKWMALALIFQSVMLV